MVDVGVCVGLLIERPRVVAIVVRLREFVFEQHEIGGVRPTGSQSDPCFGDVGVRVVASVCDGSVIVLDRMFFAEQVVLDLLDIVVCEVRPVDARMVGENAGDVVDITVVASEMVVGVFGPFERREVVAWPDRSARIGEVRFVWYGGVTGRVISRIRVWRVAAALAWCRRTCTDVTAGRRVRNDLRCLVARALGPGVTNFWLECVMVCAVGPVRKIGGSSIWDAVGIVA